MPALTKRLLASTALTRASVLSVGFALSGANAVALPQNGQVVGGNATISQVSPNQLDIVQTSSRAVIDWQSFSIGKNETTNFIQPNSSSVAVNRVTGVDPSRIEGHLSATGQVVLINPNGVRFTKTAHVNVGGLVATTTNISNQNAMSGNMVFDQSGNPNASVVNAGTITARQGGLVALVAPNVANSGVIVARLGKVSLSSGDKWTLDLYGDRLVSFALNDAQVGAVVNSDLIRADGGEVQLTANQAKGIVNTAINMTGVVEATSFHTVGGTIILDGGTNGQK